MNGWGGVGWGIGGGETCRHSDEGGAVFIVYWRREGGCKVCTHPAGIPHGYIAIMGYNR